MKIQSLILAITIMACGSKAMAHQDMRARLTTAANLVNQPSFSHDQLVVAADTMRDFALTAEIMHTGISLILRSLSGNEMINVDIVGGNEALSALYLLLYKSFECALERNYYPPLHLIDGVRTSINFETVLTKIGSSDEPKNGLLFLAPFTTNLIEYGVQALALKLGKRIYPDAIDYDSRRTIVFLMTALYDALITAGTVYCIKMLCGEGDEGINTLSTGIIGLAGVRIARRFAEETIGAWLHAKIQGPKPTEPLVKGAAL